MNKYEIKNAWNRIDKSEESSIEKFSFEYMDFIDRSKTERVCINEIRRTAKEHGFVDLDKLISENTKLIPGMKMYAENNHKSAVLFVIGDEPIENGFKMVGSHVDSPRIDLKPNPFTNKTYIQFEHNCDDVLDVNVQVYTITGKLVRTFSTTVTSTPFLEGYRTHRTAIEWDGNDDFGAPVGKGTYIYKVLVKSQNQEKCKGTASLVEKLVILK